MRSFRSIQGIREQNPFRQFAAGSIFARQHRLDARDSDQTEAKRFANQLSYANPAYSYDGKTAPSFFGYSGLGYGGVKLGFTTTSNVLNFTPALYVVPANQPTKEWVYVDNSGNPQPAGFNENLQASFTAVPTPELSALRVKKAGGLTATGTDRELCIYRPATDEYWEVFAFDEPTPAEGTHTFKNAAYVPNFSTFSGVFPTGGSGVIHGARACGLAAIGGSIMWQDLIEVLRGGKIKHAVSMGVLVAQGPANAAHRAPAKRNDNRENVAVFEEDGVTPNPAHGAVDQIKEGAWFCFPAASHASEFGITKPVEVALFEAIRDYGLFANDVSGASALSWEYPGSLGSPYSWAKVNPLAGSSDWTVVNEEIGSTWTDASLPKLTEHFGGPSSILTKQPWKELELLVPFAS